MSADGRIYLSPPWTDAAERRAVEAAFESKYIAPCGPMVDEFERRLGSLSGLSAAAVSSGTAALDLLMDEFGVEIDMADLEPENFNSAEAIWEFIQSL